MLSLRHVRPSLRQGLIFVAPLEPARLFQRRFCSGGFLECSPHSQSRDSQSLRAPGADEQRRGADELVDVLGDGHLRHIERYT